MQAAVPSSSAVPFTRRSATRWTTITAVADRGMLLEPRLHLAEGLEGLAQLRLIDGVDIVILDSA